MNEIDIHTNDELAQCVGERIAEFLNLKKGFNGMYGTEWGEKSEKGLARSMEALIGGVIGEFNANS